MNQVLWQTALAAISELDQLYEREAAATQGNEVLTPEQIKAEAAAVHDLHRAALNTVTLLKSLRPDWNHDR